MAISHQNSIIDLLQSFRPALETVAGRRDEIAHRLIRSSTAIDQVNFNRLATRDLHHLFELYDEYFFNNQFEKLFHLSLIHI